LLKSRCSDSLEWLQSFGFNLLVHCARCGECENSKFVNASPGFDFTCTCIGCGYSDKHHVNSLPAYEYSTDWHKRLDLWLQTDCCSTILWALNAEHLGFLEQYVSAELRQRRRNEFGWSNKSLFGRLPQWMTSAKNRDEVLRCIERLRSLLPAI